MYVRPRPRFRPRNAGGVSFSPASLFTSGVAGAWYDPSDYSTLFQDSAGTTPVTAVEQPVGLMLDKSQGLATSAELVPDYDFATPASWTPETADWVVSGGKATYTKPGAGVQYLQSNDNISIVSGTWYKLTVVISGIASGNAIFGLHNKTASVNYLGAYQTISANGTYSFYFLATSSTTGIRIYGNAGGTATSWSFESFGIKSIAGNHASQATAASRPVLRARYTQLTYSEQFDNAVWSIAGVTRSADVTTAPDGTVTADRITGSSGTGAILFSTNAYTALAGNLTLSCYIKAGTADYAVLSLWQGTGSLGVNLWVNVQTGAVGSNSATAGYTFVSGSSTAVGNGWYRVVLTGTVPAGAVYFSLRLVDGDNAFNYTNTVGKTLFIWGADLRTGSSAGTYQRIAAATDYATAGFLPYLAFDGVDDSMATGAFNISSTDKLNAVSGSSFFSSTANAILYCNGSDPTTTAGTFALRVNTSTKVQSLLFGSSLSNFEPTIPAIPSTNVLSHLLDIGAAINLENGIRVNGASATYAANSAGTGNFSATAPFYLGRLGGTSNPINAGLYQIVICGKTLSASELASTEAYVATKTGVVI